MGFLLDQPLYDMEGLQKGLLQTYKIIYKKILAPDNWKFPRPTCVIVKQVLVLYLVDFL